MCLIVFLLCRRPPVSSRTATLFPYPPLFRSKRAGGKYALGHILFMEMDGHDSPLWPKPPVRNHPLATGNERRPFRPKVAIFTPFTRLKNRSEEHTSELQSLMRISYAVFCLKKKKKTQRNKTYTQRTKVRTK